MERGINASTEANTTKLRFDFDSASLKPYKFIGFCEQGNVLEVTTAPKGSQSLLLD